MNWAPIAGAAGGYLIGDVAGSMVEATSGVPLVGLAAGIGGGYLGYKYVASHPAAAVPLLLGAVAGRILLTGLALAMVKK